MASSQVVDPFTRPDEPIGQTAQDEESSGVEALSIAFAPWMVAGVRTQWDNMRAQVLARDDIRPYVVEINPYRVGGALERSPLPRVVSGNVRSIQCGLRLFQAPVLDAVWTHEIRAATPYMLLRGRRRHVPLVITVDSTSVQQASFGYYAKSEATSLLGRARHVLERAFLRQATVLNPWSAWAGRSMRDDYGVADERIVVAPPGIDLARWPFVDRSKKADGDPVRLLFVGGDFVRKGGDLLLDVFAALPPGSCELHLVTRDPVPPRPHVFVYPNFMPNDPGLRDLYARCDVFVLPTRADVFSLASMEAMATGLPVVTTAIGGIPEIVDEGLTGFMITPDDGAALSARIKTLLASSERRAMMGAEGRRVVEQRFDASINTTRLLDLVVSLARGNRRRTQ